ncbi:hypothetical protein BR93DRAFT_924348 [Coniochaeta sp. PMI_546]|nr:hypothetical protein BR93DRAFT_924348 [Coniochaeta sp. PMI_546]
MPRQIVLPFHHLAAIVAFLSFSSVDRLLVTFEVSQGAEADTYLAASLFIASIAFCVTSLVLSVHKSSQRCCGYL